MSDQPDAVYTSTLRLLIARAKTLSDPERLTQESELNRLKSDAENCLALLGPEMEPIYRRVTQLDFRIPYTAGRFGTGKLLHEGHAYQTLDELRSLLQAALQRVSKRPSPPATPRAASPSEGAPGARTSYSEQDEKLFQMLGPELFQNFTNPEIRQQFLRKAKRELGRHFEGDGFRACLKRIRRHHGFPSSEQIRKKRSRRPTTSGQNWSD